MSCSLVPRPGVPVDGYLFGLNSILGPIVTLPYDDPELLAAGRALGAGTLRWPGGTVSNFWSIKDCNYAASAISSWKDRYDAVSQRPGGTFSPLNFWNGVVHWPVLWDASGFAGKNVPLPDEEVDGVGYLVGCVVGYLVGVTGEGVGNLAGVGTQQEMPAGPAHFPVTVDEDDEHSEVFLHSAALSPVYPP